MKTLSYKFSEQWHRVISDANWEKGKIISAWCQFNQLTPQDFVNEHGGLTVQHAERLLQVWQKFRRVRGNRKNLYWVHHYAALDWDDSSYWLALANKNSWTVSKMRQERWAAG